MDNDARETTKTKTHIKLFEIDDNWNIKREVSVTHFMTEGMEAKDKDFRLGVSGKQSWSGKVLRILKNNNIVTAHFILFL